MIVYNSLIPFRGFMAITIWPFIFVRKEYKSRFDDVCLRHENIHVQQQKELLLIFFYVIYLLEWLINLFRYGGKKAYYMISFEREAYAHENDENYKRKHFAQWRKEK